jgi:hypothetical protein
MTKKELAAKMEAFIAQQNAHNVDDWYVSDQDAAKYVLSNFAIFLGVKLGEHT